LNVIGPIVRAARERAGLSVNDVATRANVEPVSRLEALEAERPGMTTAQLTRVAEVLSLAPGALLQGREERLGSPSVFLRRAAHADFHDADSTVMDRALEQGRALRQLARLLNEPSDLLRHWPHKAAGGDRPDRAAHEGYDLARRVRRALANVEAPFEDMRALLEERFGVAVVVEPLRTTRLRAVSVRDDLGATVILAANDPERAQNSLLARVHLAHELCHLLFDPSEGGLHLVLDWVGDRRDSRAEQRARGFAAELLLPLAGLQQLFGSPAQVREPMRALEMTIEARARFSAPHEITANHLCNLKLVAPELREWLAFPAAGRRGQHQTSLPRDGERSVRLQVLVRRAHEADQLTDGEAKNLLGMDGLALLPWEDAPE
jgi:Zn-dependent peptidase ImmA (M78 family)/transcriptional regulator with XRE-family HTH domain